MTTRDKIGVAVLLGLFVAFCLILVWTIRPMGPSSHRPEDSPFVKMRMIHLEKSR